MPNKIKLKPRLKKSKFEERTKTLLAKKLIVFDLDGTLTESKAVLDGEMASLLGKLLGRKLVAVIGGGSYLQFKNQFLTRLKLDKKLLRNISLCPTSGSSFYSWRRARWTKIYEYKLSVKEKKEIMAAFEMAFHDIGYVKPEKIYGKIIEDRGSQITFSALGQKAPLNEKERWNKETNTRAALKTILEKYLPKFEVRLGGLTSIDVTRKDIDKTFGIKQMAKILKVSTDEMVFIGDALYKDGNDYPVKRSGVSIIKVKDVEETKALIRSILLIDNFKNKGRSQPRFDI